MASILKVDTIQDQDGNNIINESGDTITIGASGDNVNVGTGATVDSSNNLKFNSGYGSVATAYGCRAWVNFNGTGTVAIREDGNVTSITDNGIGLFGVNLTNALTDINYAIVVNSGFSGTSANSGRTLATGNAVTTSLCAINTKNASTNTLEDYTLNCVALFR